MQCASFSMASQSLMCLNHTNSPCAPHLQCWAIVSLIDLLQLTEMYLYEGKRRGKPNSGIVFLKTVLVLMSEHLVLWCFGGQSLNEATYFRVPPGPSTSSPFSPLPGAVQWVHCRRWFCLTQLSAHRPASIADSFQIIDMFLKFTFGLWGNISWEHHLQHMINHLKKWRSSDFKKFCVVQHLICQFSIDLVLYSYRIENSWAWLNCENRFLPWLGPLPACSVSRLEVLTEQNMVS